MLEVLRTMNDKTAKKPQMPQMNINLQMNLYLDSVDNKEGAGPFLASTRYDGLYHYDGKNEQSCTFDTSEVLAFEPKL